MDDYSNGFGSSDPGAEGHLLADGRDGPDPYLRLLVDSFPPVKPDMTVWDEIEARTLEVPADSPESRSSRSPQEPSSRFIDLAHGRMGAMLGIAAMLLALLGTVFVVDAVRSDPVVSASDGVVRQLANPSSGELAVTIVTVGDGSSVATAENLPPLPSSQTYQLWSVVGGEVVSVGVLGANPTDVQLRIEGEPTVLALSVERAGGVAVSAVDPVAVWQSS
ncbi:MAG: anti-sigma factor domain-containing protein [Acidimicrobiia bacterium]